MKIAMLHDSWWPVIGGGPIHVQNLAQELTDQYNCNVDIFTRSIKYQGKYYTKDYVYNGGINVYRRPPATTYFNPVGRIMSIFSLVPWIRLDEYDLIHAHTYLPSISGELCYFLADTPVILTVHGTAIPTGVGLSNSGMINKIERYCEKVMTLRFDYDHVISVNKDNTNILRNHHDRVSYIPNGVDIDKFNINTDKIPGRILFLGRLSREKRINDIIDAFPAVKQEIPEAELIIVGSGPEEEHLKEKAESTLYPESIVFIDQIPYEETPWYYSSAELFVLPSLREGHPLTLLEAWAAGTATIATDVEGISEYVEHDHTGYLVEPCSPIDLSKAIIEGLSNDERRQKWSSNAKNLVQSTYTWTECARKVYEVYREVVE